LDLKQNHNPEGQENFLKRVLKFLLLSKIKIWQNQLGWNGRKA